MSENVIEDVKDIQGYSEYNTPQGTMHSVFYPAVREYHDALAADDADVDKMVNFSVSIDTAFEVAKNVRELVTKINNGVYPDLDLNKDVPVEWRNLPAQVFIRLGSGSLKLIHQARNVPIRGSYEYQQFIKKFDELRKLLARIVSNGFLIPNTTYIYYNDGERWDREKLARRSLMFSGMTVDETEGLRKRTVKRRRLVASTPLPVLGAGLAGFTLSMGEFLLLGGGAACLAVAGVIISYGVRNNTTLAISSGLKVANVSSKEKKMLAKAAEEYPERIKPYLDEMKKYLLLENPASKNTLILEEKAQPVS